MDGVSERMTDAELRGHRRAIRGIRRLRDFEKRLASYESIADRVTDEMLADDSDFETDRAGKAVLRDLKRVRDNDG